MMLVIPWITLNPSQMKQSPLSKGHLRTDKGFSASTCGCKQGLWTVKEVSFTNQLLTQLLGNELAFLLTWQIFIGLIKPHCRNCIIKFRKFVFLNEKWGNYFSCQWVEEKRWVGTNDGRHGLHWPELSLKLFEIVDSSGCMWGCLRNFKMFIGLQ